MSEDYALGDDDISKILPNTHIFTYPYLKQVKDIDEVFDDEGRAVMLYLTESGNSGHWTCLIRRPNQIEFFDPYGEFPDTELNWISKSKRDELDEQAPYLSKLLRESGLPIVYNKHHFQGDGDNISTCGRHSSVRLLFKDLSLPQYANMIEKSGMNPDDFVTAITYSIIKK